MIHIQLKHFGMICRHLLIAFGGLAGLEESIEEDNKLKVIVCCEFIRHLIVNLLFSFFFLISQLAF